MVLSSPVLAVDAVVEPALAVAVRVDHLLRTVFFRHVREAASLFQDAGRRIMQEHDEFAISIRLCQVKRFPKPHQLSGHQFPGVLFLFFVPAHNSASTIDVERSLKSKTFRRDNSVVLVGVVAVLHEGQFRLVQLIEHPRLLHVPEHVMVATCQNLASRQFADIPEVPLAFRQVLAPAVIANKDQSVLWGHCFGTVLAKLLFVVFPYTAVQLPRCFQHGLVMQVQVADRVKAHNAHPSGV